MDVRELPIDHVVAARNIRRGDLDVAELAESIREHGVLQPIRVRSLGDDRYQVVAGHRRLAAGKRAGLRTIPAVISDDSAVRAAAQSVVENLQRENLSPVDLIRGIKELQTGYGLTEEEIARAISKSPSQVRLYLRAAVLPNEILERLESGEGRTQEVTGPTVRHVAPLLSGATPAEATARINQLLDTTFAKGIRINAHMADAIARDVNQGRLSVPEAVDAVLREPEKYRYGRAPASPAELEGDTWRAYRRIHRELLTLASKLRPEIASAFGDREKRDLLESLNQLASRLDPYGNALATGNNRRAAERSLLTRDG